MRNQKCLFSALVLGLAVAAAVPAAAQQHRATRLGNPATRFAPPLATPEDLRARFSDPKLKPDIASILQQWGWKGELADLFTAAARAEIKEIKMPTGTRMPFMSSRESGKPVTLRDVLWAGKEPISAYIFDFTSKGRFYRCITPRPCSNFFVEDLGAPALTVACKAPGEVPAGRPAEVCLTVRNTGDALEPKARVSLPIPQGATLLRTTAGGAALGSNVVWEIPNFATNASREFCAAFTMPQPGMMPFVATAAGTMAQPARTSCESRIIGIPAILIDAVDLEDPVEVGHEVTYDIKITNQGAVPCTNLRLVCTLPENEEYVSGSGPTGVSAQGSTVTTEALPSFAPKSVVTWRVVVKALKAGDVRFKVNVYADEFEKPIYEEESTLLN
ncbi:MAG TPA: hypothetical protein VJA21_25060 [Verrucomicrobiae bacterium]